MPYKVFSTGGKFAVHKVDEDGKPVGKPIGTHTEKPKAEAQVRALYASEKKPKKEAEPISYTATSEGAKNVTVTVTGSEGNEETKEADHEKCYGDEIGYMPIAGPTTFADLEAEQAAREAAYEMHELTHNFQRLASNIMTASDVEDKAAALTALASEYASLVSDKAKLDTDKEQAIAKQIAGNNQPETTKSTTQQADQQSETTDAPGGDSEQKDNDNPRDLFIWKEGDVYRWIAAYSNNRRDDDNPPEIISSESHKEFDQALEKGEWEMPEAYLWHVSYPVGITTYHAYDEATGFPVAAGHFYKGMDWAAEGILKAQWDGVSHGMPTEWIKRDPDDPTIIIRHRTKEISFLPRWAAANKLSFNYVIKELEMEQKELPAHKRPNFVEAFGEDRAKQIEAALDGKSKEADEAEVEKKEATAEPAGVTQKEIATVLTQIKEMFVAMDGRLKALEEEPKEKEAESFDLVSILKSQSAIGKQETKVDGRSSLAKDGPEEAQGITPTQQTVGVPVGLLDGLFQLNQGWYNGGKG